MSELSERARAVAEKVNETCVYHYKPALNVADTAELIEQALLRERRLAMEEAAKIAEEPIVRLTISRDKAKAAGRECVSSCRESDIETRYAVAKSLRSVATPRGGE